MTELRRITRALHLRFRQDRAVEFARALAGHGVELVSTGGTAKALADAGLTVQRRVGAHRLSRDDGRPRQDAASRRCMAACWRSATTPSTRRRCTTHGIAPIDLLVVNLYPFEATVAKGAGLRRLHREHRHRRAGDDPRGGQEPRRRRRGRRCRTTTPRVLAELAAHGGATTLALRKTLAAQGLCAHRRLRRGDLQLVRRRRSARRAPAYRAFGGKLAEALRYGENPHQSAAFYRTPRAALRRRHRAAAAGQGALLQQHQRHRRGLRMRRRVRSASAPRPASSSSTPIRAASR